MAESWLSFPKSRQAGEVGFGSDKTPEDLAVIVRVERPDWVVDELAIDVWGDRVVTSAIEEQAVTTQEIGKNVGDTANGSADISRSIQSVAGLAQQSDQHIAEAVGLVERLGNVNAELERVMGQFRY